MRHRTLLPAPVHAALEALSRIGYSTSEAIGKDVRQDDDRVTFITLWGEKRTRAAIAETIDEALESVGDRNCALARYTLNLFHQAGYGG